MSGISSMTSERNSFQWRLPWVSSLSHLSLSLSPTFLLSTIQYHLCQWNIRLWTAEWCGLPLKFFEKFIPFIKYLSPTVINHCSASYFQNAKSRIVDIYVIHVSFQIVMAEYLKEMGLRASTTTRAPTSALIATRPHRTSPSGGNGQIHDLVWLNTIFRGHNHSTAWFNACTYWWPSANGSWHSAYWSTRNHWWTRSEHWFVPNLSHWMYFVIVGAPGERTTEAGGVETTAAGVEGYLYFWNPNLSRIYRWNGRPPVVPSTETDAEAAYHWRRGWGHYWRRSRNDNGGRSDNQEFLLSRVNSINFTWIRIMKQQFRWQRPSSMVPSIGANTKDDRSVSHANVVAISRPGLILRRKNNNNESINALIWSISYVVFDGRCYFFLCKMYNKWDYFLCLRMEERERGIGMFLVSCIHTKICSLL